MTELDQVFAIVADRLPQAGVDCLLIGGFAVNQYGYTRNTLDVDFMIVTEQFNLVRGIMIEAGFTNVSVHDNVAFFQVPDSTLRVDFLRVDRTTMEKLCIQANEVRVQDHVLKIPALKDLIAMKIFALAQNTQRRMGKDLPDIAYLSVLNDLDIETDVRPLCDRFGTEKVFELIRDQMEALSDS